MSRLRPRTRRGRLTRALVMLGVVVALAIGGAFGSVWLLNHAAPRYRNALLADIGQRIHARIGADDLSLGWGWTGPIVYLSDVRIVHNGETQPALTARRIDLEFSLPALAAGHRLPRKIVVNGASADLIAAHGRLRLAHWPAAAAHALDIRQIDRFAHAIDGLAVKNSHLEITSARLPGGRADWHDLDIAITRDSGDRLAAHLSAAGPAWLGHLDAKGRVAGALSNPQLATFSAHLAGLDTLAIAHAAAGASPELTGGSADLTLHGKIQGHRLVDSRIKLAAAAIRPAGGPGAAGRNARPTEATAPLIPALTAVIRLQSDVGFHHLAASLVRFSGPRKPPDGFAAQATIDTGKPAITASASNLPSALAMRIARWAVPKLANTRIKGRFSKADLSWAPGAPPRLAVDFSNLRIDAPAFGFGPVSGRYRQTGSRHSLVFTGAHGSLRAQRYLHGTLAVSDLTGGIVWQRAKNGALNLALHQLRLASREARISTSGTLRFVPGAGKPTADLTADASAPDLARLLDHLPQAPDLPNPRLRQWLPKAITAGTLDHAHLSVRGPLSRFPFPDAKGNNGFHVALYGHGVDVHYKPGWPTLEDARAKLAIDGDTLAVSISHARMLGVDIGPAEAHVADVREPILKLTGQAQNAPANRLLAFLGDSPLRDKFAALIRAIKVSGPADLNVDLRLPLKPGLGKPVVSGSVNARGDTLRESHLPGPLTAIRGAIHFAGDGLSAQGLSAKLLGVAVAADLKPNGRRDQQIVARATPSLPADRSALAHYLPAAWLVYGDGPLPLKVAFSLSGHGAISPITVDSDLAGTAVHLPAPLAKPANKKAPLHVVIDPHRHQVIADYDHRLRMNVALGTTGGVRRILVHIGDRKVTPPAANGLWIGGDAKTVDGIGWFDVIHHVLHDRSVQATNASQPASHPTSSSPPAAAGLPFLGGNLRIGRLTIGDRYIAGPRVRVHPLASSPGWQIDLAGADSQGQVQLTDLPGDALRLVGNLSRLAIQTPGPTQRPRARTQAKSDTSTDTSSDSLIWPQLSPLDLPALQIDVKHFVVDDTRFGETHVDAHRTHDGWHLDRFALAGGALTGRLSAYWQRDGALTSATARAHFQGAGLSRLVRSFGYPSPVQAKRTVLDADLAIAPNVAGLDLLHLNGHMTLALDNGTFLTVEPGPGRLLGLFNLYVLPRRLMTMNFRDVLDKGLAFDKVRAKFNIRHGQAYCQDATIKTPSAHIDITGRIGIATRDYDEEVKIQPKIGGSVTLASTVFGGPIVGAAVFAIQQILKKPIAHFSTLSYRLKGQWDNPKIVEPRAEPAASEPNSATPAASAPKTPDQP